MSKDSNMVNFTVDDELLKRMDEAVANNNYLYNNRSHLMRVAIVRELDRVEDSIRKLAREDSEGLQNEN